MLIPGAGYVTTFLKFRAAFRVSLGPPLRELPSATVQAAC